MASSVNRMGWELKNFEELRSTRLLLKNDNLSRLNDCFLAVHRWFAEHGLALNPEKSEVIVIGTGARYRHESAIDAVTLGDAPIAVSSTEPGHHARWYSLI